MHKSCDKVVEYTANQATSFVDLLYFFCLVFVMPLCASVYLCLVVTWEKLTSWLSIVVSECVTFPLVSWVRCGT